MDGPFQERFITEWAHSDRAGHARNEDPREQTTENTAVGSPMADADTDDHTEQGLFNSQEGDQPSQSERDIDEQQYTLDGIKDALPDDTSEGDESATTGDNSSPATETDETTESPANDSTEAIETESGSDDHDPADFW